MSVSDKYKKLSDYELYIKLKNELLPMQKDYLKFQKKQLNELLRIIEKGKLKFEKGLMSEFKYAGFKRETKEIMKDIKLDIEHYESEIKNVDNYVKFHDNYQKHD